MARPSRYAVMVDRVIGIFFVVLVVFDVYMISAVLLFGSV